MSAPHSDVLEWIGLADQDLGAAMLTLRQGQYPGIAGFHVQQAIEKYLKGLLTASGRPFPLIHDLVALHDLCTDAGISIAVTQADLVRLTRFGVAVRYPGFASPPSPAEARRAILVAARVRRQTRRLLGLS
jgi:HEPN domain-containing protein